MQVPPLPEEESERQKTLDKTGLLNSGSEARFDRITRLAQQIFSVPIALISLVDRDRQWFKSRQGLDAQQTPREISFCGHAILNSEIFVIENALVDQRFCDNPLVMGAPDIRFYAGAPLHSTKGYRIGTLCLIDSQPQSFSSKQRSMLKDLAATVEALIQAEELSNERLGKLTAQLPGVVYQFQRFASGKITFPFSSPQILDLYGITPEQAAQDASPAFERIHPDDLQAISDSIEHSANTLEYWQATYRVRYQGQDYRWFAGQAKPERLSDGSVLWHGYLHDIHEQEQARQTTERNEARLRSLFDFSPIGIALNDFETGQFLDLNNALIAPTDYTREEFIALSYWDITPQEYQSLEEQALANLNTTGRYGPFEKEYIRKDGSRYPVRLQGMLSKEQDGRTVIWSLIEDITERRKLDKMKDQFISTISHELRTPLTSIKGSLNLLAGGAVGSISDKAQALLVTAERNAQRLTTLINDLLDMEKLVAGKMPMTFLKQPLGPLLDETIDSLSSYAQQHNVVLQCSGSWPAVQVNVDGQRLIQALSNLLSNAIKFSPQGEAITIKVQQQDTNIHILVRDRGQGVAPEFEDRLFQRFSQADSSDTRKLPGTGLGLAITQEICQQLGGSVMYRQPNGRGAEFIIQLPIG
ncbi:ATP-binding protein [Vibrio metschnikovii]|uniref:ATP-binding protein n=1 Tax=Vibrio metschnikovii TaxID=28172 RepID=UPI0001B93F30|nr:ATP-binding protein [Vibrio metschnikovii]EEX35659.1 signal transduction histidine kinase [Vibrio metschnikovii CIP 69.14]SUP11417.1 GGDEF domain-containing protein [Vibrio metschnikovii]SUP50885.1 GGDEF domain-containing protein [Vibrio metschnikovii]